MPVKLMTRFLFSYVLSSSFHVKHSLVAHYQKLLRKTPRTEYEDDLIVKKAYLKETEQTILHN